MMAIIATPITTHRGARAMTHIDQAFQRRPAPWVAMRLDIARGQSKAGQSRRGGGEGSVTARARERKPTWHPPQPMDLFSMMGVKRIPPKPMITVRPLKKTALPAVAKVST